MKNRLAIPITVSLVTLATSCLLSAEEGPKEAHSYLPAVLSAPDGSEIDRESLTGKFVAIYFSAGWCPPCRSFTPKLVEFYENKGDANFEIVFASFDHSDEDKASYIAKSQMPWPSLPGASSAQANALAQHLQISGLPTLVVMDPEGRVVTMDGRTDVLFTPNRALQKWKVVDPS